jgi:hypothetical protein
VVWSACRSRVSPANCHCRGNQYVRSVTHRASTAPGCDYFLCGVLTAFSTRVLIGGSRLHLYPSAGHVGFWERNSEKILVSLILNLLSGLAGFLLGRLFH